MRGNTRTRDALQERLGGSALRSDDALKVLSLPREVGADKDGEMITAQNGRYGPYLKKGTDSRSLTSEEQIFTITLDEAKAIYAEPKRRGRAAARGLCACRCAAAHRAPECQ